MSPSSAPSVFLHNAESFLGIDGPLVWWAVGGSALLLLMVLIMAVSGAGQNMGGDTSSELDPREPSGPVPRRDRPGVVRGAQRALYLNGGLASLSALSSCGAQESGTTVAAIGVLVYGAGCLFTAWSLARPNPTPFIAAMILQLPLVIIAVFLAVLVLVAGEPLLFILPAVPFLLALNAASLLYRARDFYLAHA